MSRLKCKESIADLWGYPDCKRPKRPSTEELFKAIAAEAEMCLRKADWDSRILRIENILSVIKWRIREFWERSQYEQLLERVHAVRRADGEEAEVMKNVVEQKG